MEPLIILQAVTVDQILSKIEDIIERKLDEKIAQLNPSKKWRYISRKEVAELLKISLPTLHDWTKLGLVISYRIGNRVLYKSNEIEASVKEIKYSRNFSCNPTVHKVRGKNN